MSRPLVFVCSSVSKNGELISKMIVADTQNAAALEFDKNFAIQAQIILGPFYKKSTQILESTRSLQFTKSGFKKAIFNDWLVHAFSLVEPADHAYLIFIKKADNIQSPKPKGTIIVPISSLRMLDG